MKNLSDEELLKITRRDIAIERSATAKVLLDIKEIEERKLFLKRGYPSLFKFLRDEFHYSEAEAQIRIQAMRLLKNVPEIEKKLESGCLSLTNASKIQSFLYKKDVSHEEKMNLIQKMENKSTRECERTLFGLFPGSIPKEKIKIVSNKKTELKFSIDEKTFKEFQEFKNLCAHKLSEGTLEEAFTLMLSLSLKKIKEKARVEVSKKAPRAQLKQGSKTGKPRKLPQMSNIQQSKKIDQSKPQIKPSRYIPAQLRKKVFERDLHQCTYKDSITQKQCKSQYKLEIDHKIPFALGGPHELSNLRLLCSAHNKFISEKFYDFNFQRLKLTKPKPVESKPESIRNLRCTFVLSGEIYSPFITQLNIYSSSYSIPKIHTRNFGNVANSK